jgi:hypothetical protein
MSDFVLCPAGKIAKIYIRSEGCNDRGKYRGCGRAYIKVNGRDYSRHRRGHNIVVLNGFTGTIKLNVSFFCQKSVFPMKNRLLKRRQSPVI